MIPTTTEEAAALERVGEARREFAALQMARSRDWKEWLRVGALIDAATLALSQLADRDRFAVRMLVDHLTVERGYAKGMEDAWRGRA
jgi:hypothetical protein